VLATKKEIDVSSGYCRYRSCGSFICPWFSYNQAHTEVYHVPLFWMHKRRQTDRVTAFAVLPALKGQAHTSKPRRPSQIPQWQEPWEGRQHQERQQRGLEKCVGGGSWAMRRGKHWKGNNHVHKSPQEPQEQGLRDEVGRTQNRLQSICGKRTWMLPDHWVRSPPWPHRSLWQGDGALRFILECSATSLSSIHYMPVAPTQLWQPKTSRDTGKWDDEDFRSIWTRVQALSLYFYHPRLSPFVNIVLNLALLNVSTWLQQFPTSHPLTQSEKQFIFPQLLSKSLTSLFPIPITVVGENAALISMSSCEMSIPESIHTFKNIECWPGAGVSHL
jgi:hypothetical protein